MAMLNNQRVSISGYVNLWNVYGKSLGQIWFYGNICGKSLSGWWFGTWLYFSLYGNSIIPTDELMFFRGVGIPPTSSFCLGLPPHFPNFSLEQITNPKKPPTSFCFFVFRYNLLTNWGWTSSAPFLLFTAHSFYLGLPPLPPHFPIKMFGTNHKRHHQPVSVFGFFLVLCGQVAVDLSVLGSKSTPRRSSFSGSAVRRASTVGGFGFERRKSDAEWIFGRLGFGGLFNGAHDFMVILGWIYGI